MYDFLEPKGLQYAELANGVAKKNTVAGNVAMNFMNLSAKEVGLQLDADKTREIVYDMADEYLGVITKVSAGGALTRDIKFREALDFHKKVFEAHGLSRDAWTLTAVFEALGENQRDPYWAEVLNSAGNLRNELQLSLTTRAKMQLSIFGDTPEKRELAVSWIEKTESPSSLFAIAASIGNITYKAAEAMWSEEDPAANPNPSSLIKIDTISNPQPRPKIQDESTATQNITDGYVANEPTHKFFFLGGELDKTDFTSTQLGALATGNLRPGEIQLNTNVQPTQHLEQFYLDQPANGAADFSLRNAAVLNGLAAQTTENIFIDPLLLDLTGTGVQMTPISDGVLFDTDNSGTLKRTGWADRSTGMLVVDNGGGQITSISQMISEYYGGAAGTNGAPGAVTFKDAFAALASEDGNADAVITAADPAWAKLRVWVDASHDGRSDAGELKTLDELGITQINLTAEPIQGDIRQGNSVIAKGSFVINGETREALAVNFLGDTVSNLITAEGTGNKLLSTAGGVTTSAYASNATTDQNLDATALGVTNLYGGSGNDTLTAAATGSWLVGGPGANTYNGGAGDDVFVISASDDPMAIKGNGGRDTAIIVGEAGVALNLAKAGLTMAQGGRGNDYLISGGNNGVFLKGGSGGSVLLGGGGNDVLVGGGGRNLIVGGSGKSVIYAGPQGDRISASAGGSIIYAGGGKDIIEGGAGNDVIEVGRGAAVIDGGAGTNILTVHGSYGEYQITPTESGYQIGDKVVGRDGTVNIANIQKINFADISAINIDSPNALPVADAITTDAAGTPLDRHSARVISAAALLANDQLLKSTGPLKISAVSDAMGGTASLNEQGDVLFTPTVGHMGVMSFKYALVDSAGNPAASIVHLGSGELAPMRATVTLQTAEMPTDPLAARQWYLSDIGVLPVWQDYTGKGVRIGQFEPGGKYSSGPELFDYDHPDLKANVDPAWLTTQTTNGTLAPLKSDHATMVAGVMVAGRNDQGGVGVAYGATLGGHYLANSGADLTALGNMVNYDVVNHSWGFTNDFALSNVHEGMVTTAAALTLSAQAAATNGRGGLGTVMVAAGGNEREKGGSAQGSLMNNNRYSIEVGAINAQADLSTLVIGAAPFSNPGASLLVSAPGSNVLSTSRQLQTERGSTFGNDYSAMQGTSFAAPIVSGVVALMLEANPNLGYRDVQQILALSARRVEDTTTQWADNAARHWNGGGMHKSDDYGFGKVDARAAVRLAQGWLGQRTAANEASVVGNSAVLGSVLQPGAVLNTINTLPAGIDIEHVEVEFHAQVGRLGDLQVKLIAPNGTQSLLLDRHGKSPAVDADTGNAFAGAFKYSLMSTQHWGEQSAGDWTLQVTNVATGLPVTLDKWSLRAYGSQRSADDSYYFTDEYAALAAANPARATLDDASNGTAGGRNTVNAASVTGDVSLNAATGAASLGGAVLNLVDPLGFQQLISGDGNDTLVAGSGDSLLNGGRGNNTLIGGSGRDFFVVHRRGDGSDTLGGFEPARGEVIDLVGFKGRQFADLQLTQVDTDVNIDLGAGQRLVLQGVTSDALSSANFRFQESFAGPGTFFIESGEATPPPVAAGTVIMNGGATGVSLTSDANGQFVASLSGTVYERDGTEANRFVVAQQEGVTNYSNALRGFRQGLDKIDLSQVGISDYAALDITKEQRNVINGVALIQGVMVSTKPVGTGEPLKLLYLDSLEVAQLGAADFIFAQPMAAALHMPTAENVPVALALVADNTAIPVSETAVAPQRLSIDPLIQAMAAFAPAAVGGHVPGAVDLGGYQPLLGAAVA
jgi:subtilisin-like proprotein convertase family protein/Ca2+-binding RTX toxin-like protein